MNLQGKVALITGANSGIGEAAALELAREGMRIGALGRSVDSLATVVKTITEHGGEAIVLEADVSQPEEMQRAITKLGEHWGRIDLVVANAGINGVWASLDDLTPDDWDQTIDVNLKGTYLTVKYALPYLKPQGGSVIVVSSVNGTRMFSNTGATAYAVSKAGQVVFAKMIALELAQYRIRVNAICPGSIETSIEESTEKRDLKEIRTPVKFPEGQIPLSDGEPGRAEDVAQLIRFFASDESKHISGTEIFIDGTQSLLRG